MPWAKLLLASLAWILICAGYVRYNVSTELPLYPDADGGSAAVPVLESRILLGSQEQLQQDQWRCFLARKAQPGLGDPSACYDGGRPDRIERNYAPILQATVAALLPPLVFFIFALVGRPRKRAGVNAPDVDRT